MHRSLSPPTLSPLPPADSRLFFSLAFPVFVTAAPPTPLPLLPPLSVRSEIIVMNRPFFFFLRRHVKEGWGVRGLFGRRDENGS